MREPRWTNKATVGQCAWWLRRHLVEPMTVVDAAFGILEQENALFWEVEHKTVREALRVIGARRDGLALPRGATPGSTRRATWRR